MTKAKIDYAFAATMVKNMLDACVAYGKASSKAKGAFIAKLVEAHAVSPIVDRKAYEALKAETIELVRDGAKKDDKGQFLPINDNSNGAKPSLQRDDKAAWTKQDTVRRSFNDNAEKAAIALKWEKVKVSPKTAAKKRETAVKSAQSDATTNTLGQSGMLAIVFAYMSRLDRANLLQCQQQIAIMLADESVITPPQPDEKAA